MRKHKSLVNILSAFAIVCFFMLCSSFPVFASAGDTFTFTGTWTGHQKVFSNNTGTHFATGQVSFMVSSVMESDFFLVGHTYHVSGDVYSYFNAVSGTQYSYCNVDWYWPTEDGKIFLCSSAEDDYYSPLDFTFLYYGQTVGPVYECSVVGSSSSSIGSGYPEFHIRTGYPLVFTDLGVVSSDYDLLERIDDTTTKTYETIKENLIEEQKQSGLLEDIKDGFDSSVGDDLNSGFSNGVADYQGAEDSLFTSSKEHLDDYSFFDIQSIPAVLTGISFVSSIMDGIFDSMDGMSGAGIVLSVLFSVMLVSMAIGLYRQYQSNGKLNRRVKMGTKRTDSNKKK